MATALTVSPMSPELLKVAKRAKREPTAQFHSLAHLIDVGALRRAYEWQRDDAAVGVDGVCKREYGQDLGVNLRGLHHRLRTQCYRHRPIRRVHIPKEQSGKTRPIGISCFEDKLVQEVLREVLEAVYEQDFLDCSYGFRPGRSAHDAVRTLNAACCRGEVNWVLEADIKSFFDSLDRQKLLEMLRERIADGSLLRLVGKCLHVGVLDGEQLSTPDQGTTQGSVISPMLANIYLHYVLDRWLEQVVKPRLRGIARLVRYADDFVVLLQRQEDAQRVLEVLGKRMSKYGLTLHEEKTRLIPFQRPTKRQEGKGPGTFDFLGFTFYWRRTRRGNWRVACKTRVARLHRAVTRINEWCRIMRHRPVAEQHASLSRRLRGHFAYFGVNGNIDSLMTLYGQARRAWYKWLCRRSQKKRLTWERFESLERDFPLPTPRICVQIWDNSS